MTSKFKLRSFVFILISGAIILSPFAIHAQTPINCGQTLAGSISTSAEIDQYTFSASVNNVVTIRVRKTSGTFTPYLQLYGPTGSLITSGSRIDRTLIAEGTYRIDVKDQNNTNTGDYLLYLEKLNGPCNVAADLACEQVVSGSIGTATDPPPWRAYTFAGAVNDAVTIRLRTISGAPTMEVYDPNGVLVYNSGYRVPQVDRILTVAGTYTVLVFDYNNANAGSYTLSWRKVSTPCSSTPINCGQVSLRTISAADEMDFYTFTGAVNDVVAIRARKVTGGLSPYLELWGPSGNSITTGSEITWTLTAAGTYKIIVRDNSYVNTGDYVLYLDKLNNPCNAVDLACDQVISGSIGTSVDPPPWRIYTFSVSANDAVTIRTRKTAGSSFLPSTTLYGPTGTWIAGGDVINQTLATAGTYKIFMRDVYNAYAGNYVISWRRVSTPCSSTPINCGQVLPGTMSAADEMDFYTFTGAVNDVVAIRARKVAGALSPYLELWDPSGNSITTGSEITRTLTATGTYKISVRDSGNVNTGDYVVTLQRFNNPCSQQINCGQSASGAIGITADAPPWGFYSLTVAANDIVTIRAIKTSGTLVPFLELYNSSGGLVTSAANQINRTMSAGTYVLLLKDQSNINTGGYAVTWQKWNSPCGTAANCGQVIASSIGLTVDPPPWRYYSLTASANDSVTIRASKTSGTLTPYLEIYNSSGTQVASGAGQKDVTLTAAGTYTIVVRDQNSINSGDYAFTWLRVSNPCNATPLGCGQVFPTSLSAVGKIDVYSISANSGDNIVLTLTKTSGGLDPSLELYNSSGTRVAYQYTASGNQAVITQTLSATGTYTVFASDYGNDETGSYTLKFQKNNNSCTDVSLLAPNGGEYIPPWSILTIRWSCTSPAGITSQEIRLSTDGGMNFSTVIATGLAGELRTYNWNVPSDLSTNQARIRMIVTDGSGTNVFDDSDSDFTIYQAVGRTYVYDELNRLIQVIYEDGRRVTYTYDASGNRKTLTNE